MATSCHVPPRAMQASIAGGRERQVPGRAARRGRGEEPRGHPGAGRPAAPGGRGTGYAAELVASSRPRAQRRAIGVVRAARLCLGGLVTSMSGGAGAARDDGRAKSYHFDLSRWPLVVVSYVGSMGEDEIE